MPERASRARQRQRLIDACIAALHIHGPSRTTVEKVVALADMSPGIVRFYFESKDAMLVASLAYLAAEFEERVMTPVSRLKEAPVKALAQLVELYLDPDIASTRKVSVWYSFWGEASSRQEYLDICGKKDDDFAALVLELIQALIAQTGQTYLDADAVALGLIGVLEVLWQGFAFTEEAEIDRAAAKRRSLAYLRSIFPQEFAASGASGASTSDASLAGGSRIGTSGVGTSTVGALAAETSSGGARARSIPPVGTAASASSVVVLPAGAERAGYDREGTLPAWAYSDAALLTLERERLFRPSWQLVGHEADIPKQGDYVTANLAGERALVVRSRERDIRAFRNACRKRPHALVAAGRGHLSSKITCEVHGLVYELNGRLRSGDTPGDLVPLELALPGRFMLVRAAVAAPGGIMTARAGKAVTSLLEIAGAPTGDWETLPDLRPTGLAEIAVAADWKLLVEQWLEAPARPSGIERTFLPPNQILERSATGALLLQVIPQSPGRCVIRRLDYTVVRKAAASRKKTPTLGWLQQDIEVAESTQAALSAGFDEADSTGPISPELARFRRSIAALLSAVRSTT